MIQGDPGSATWKNLSTISENLQIRGGNLHKIQLSSCPYNFPDASGRSLSINERPMMPCVSALGRVEAPMDSEEVGSKASCWHQKTAHYGTRRGMM